MNLAGYIKLHRKMKNWRWKDHPPTLCLFIHLLLSASYETERVNGLILNPGQVVISSRSLATETGLTRMEIRTALSHLQQTGEIAVDAKPGGRSTVVTIQNWSRYQVQDASPSFQPSEQPSSETPESFAGQGFSERQKVQINPVNNPVVSPVKHQPSFQPSEQPSFQPSEQPSSETPESLQDKGFDGMGKQKQPSNQPSNQPGEQPSNQPTIYNKKTKKEKNIKKNKYGDFVLLTEDEYKKLIAVFGLTFTLKAIEVLDNYIGSKGDKYKSHYYTIRGWVKDAVQRDYHLTPQATATTTKTASGNTSPEVDPLAEWGGSL